MELQRPVVILALDHEDSAAMMAGVLWMKGCDVHKTKTASDCLTQIEGLKYKVDVVVVSADIAADRDAMLIVDIKRKNIEIKILAIGDESTDKTRILDYGADEFALKPLSPENVADKVLMLLARKAVGENRYPE